MIVPDRGRLSVIVPFYNEAYNVAPLYHELILVSGLGDLIFEIIMIDDGSSDQTLQEIKSLAEADNRIIVISIGTNKGQSYATMQGIQKASGELIAILDGDLQNDPSDLPQMIRRLYAGYDLVCGWRKERMDKKLSVLLSRIANLIIRIIFSVNIHDSGCSAKVGYSTHFKQIRFFEHFHRYIPIILAKEKLRVTEIVVNHRPRTSGQSKYKLSKAFLVIKELLFLRFHY